jgi:hypothetical protein
MLMDKLDEVVTMGLLLVLDIVVGDVVILVDFVNIMLVLGVKLDPLVDVILRVFDEDTITLVLIDTVADIDAEAFED